MNKDAFDAGIMAALQAQLDVADRLLAEANDALVAAKAAYGRAKFGLKRHVAYGEAREWIERDKRRSRQSAQAAE